MMSITLTTDILIQSVGRRVKNANGICLGKIVEIIRSPGGGTIEYIIIKSKNLVDYEDRFFAIPVSSLLIRITEAFEIILLIGKEELRMANSITPEKCPKPNLQVNPNIFKLIEYAEPETRNKNYKFK